MVSYPGQVTGDQTVSGSIQLGSATALGDNGAGVLRLANAGTAPTVAPTGGEVVYSDASSVPLKVMTPAGAKIGLVAAFTAAASDQGTTTVNTPTTSTSLTLAVEANSTYILEGFVIVNTTNAVNGLLSWTGPAGAAMQWSPVANEAGYVSTLTASDTVAGTGADKAVVYRGRLTTPGTAGAFALTFTNATAGTTTIRAGSFLRLLKVV